MSKLSEDFIERLRGMPLLGHATKIYCGQKRAGIFLEWSDKDIEENLQVTMSFASLDERDVTYGKLESLCKDTKE